MFRIMPDDINLIIMTRNLKENHIADYQLIT